MAKVIAFNKPFGVICQFSGEGDTLANYVNIPDIYPVGRLDKDSEGLVILTDDGYLQNRVSDPKYKKIKTYVVQVEGEITDTATSALEKGVELMISGFCHEVFTELPLEFASEADRLLSLKLEGSVG